MHQVTETTIQDVIDRSIIFTHTAIAAARAVGKFTFLDFDTMPSQAVHRTDPLATTGITLYRRSITGRTTPLLDKDGKEVEVRTITEAPYKCAIQTYTVYLTIPLFMTGFAAGLKDLFDLLEDPTDDAQLCSYGRAAYNELMAGQFPQEMPDFSDRYWEVMQAPAATDDSSYIPELRLPPQRLLTYPKNTCTPPSQTTFRTDQPLWQMREEARIRFSIYDQLPDVVNDILDQKKIANLFPHLSTKASNAGMIAYTQSPTAGVMDRQAVMRAGRFIRQYAKEGVSDEDVKQMAAQVASHLGSQFKHSNQREDYARVYINGPSSCMAYDETGKEFHKLKVDDVFVHPTEVYAHPENDLEIVWCEVNQDVVARTIINKKRMQFPRIYAKESVSNAERRLRDYLEDLGYKEHNHALTDQKLLRISPTKYPRAIICPYIDSSNLGVEVHDDHLVTGGSYNANHETGCLDDFNTRHGGDDWTCDCCSEGQDEDDERYYDCAGDPICESCRDDYTEAFCAESHEMRWVPNDSEKLFSLLSVTRGPLRFYSYVYLNHRHHTLDDWDLVELDDTYYDSGTAALADDCLRTENGYIRANDLGDYDLFYNEDDNCACAISGYAIQVDEDGDTELVEVGSIDDDLYEHAPRETDDEYPMLKVFTLIAQDEEAA